MTKTPHEQARARGLTGKRSIDNCIRSVVNMRGLEGLEIYRAAVRNMPGLAPNIMRTARAACLTMRENDKRWRNKGGFIP